jgi:hypothetical protein
LIPRSVLVHSGAVAEAEAVVVWYEQEQTGLGCALKADFDAAATRLEAGLDDGVPVRGRSAKTGAGRIVLKRSPPI